MVLLLTLFFAETNLDWKPPNFLQRKRENRHRQESLSSWLLLLLLSYMQREIPQMCTDIPETVLFKGCLWLCGDMSEGKFVENNDKGMVNLYCLFLFVVWADAETMTAGANWLDSSRQTETVVMKQVKTTSEPSELRTKAKKWKKNWKYERSTVFGHFLSIAWSSLSSEKKDEIVIGTVRINEPVTLRSISVLSAPY